MYTRKNFQELKTSPEMALSEQGRVCLLTDASLGSMFRKNPTTRPGQYQNNPDANWLRVCHST